LASHRDEIILDAYIANAPSKQISLMYLKHRWDRWDAACQKLLTFFQCKRCGRCCQTTPVQIDWAEVEQIAATINMHPKRFRKKFCFFRGKGLFLKSPCPFLKFSRQLAYCSIYEIRPKPCRRFPFLDLPILAAIDECALAKEIYNTISNLPNLPSLQDEWADRWRSKQTALDVWAVARFDETIAAIQSKCRLSKPKIMDKIIRELPDVLTKYMQELETQAFGKVIDDTVGLCVFVPLEVAEILIDLLAEGKIRKPL